MDRKSTWRGFRSEQHIRGYAGEWQETPDCYRFNRSRRAGQRPADRVAHPHNQLLGDCADYVAGNFARRLERERNQLESMLTEIVREFNETCGGDRSTEDISISTDLYDLMERAERLVK